MSKKCPNLSPEKQLFFIFFASQCLSSMPATYPLRLCDERRKHNRDRAAGNPLYKDNLCCYVDRAYSCVSFLIIQLLLYHAQVVRIVVLVQLHLASSPYSQNFDLYSVSFPDNRLNHLPFCSNIT